MWFDIKGGEIKVKIIFFEEVTFWTKMAKEN